MVKWNEIKLFAAKKVENIASLDENFAKYYR